MVMQNLQELTIWFLYPGIHQGNATGKHFCGTGRIWREDMGLIFCIVDMLVMGEG